MIAIFVFKFAVEFAVFAIFAVKYAMFAMLALKFAMFALFAFTKMQTLQIFDIFA